MHLRRSLLLLTFTTALSACAAQTVAPPVTTLAPAPASLDTLVAAVDIPYEKFTLPNGLTTLVHTDRKAPIVGVTVYYRVGSKHEPKGRTGFAHLFEHIMFTGSENVPNFDIPLEAAGSTPTNGSTWFDRTNYVETVPTGAVDLALFMESDRMGHLLGAVDQDKLDKQRGVVQNEKRQGDNEPYGLVDYAIGDGLFPVGHPYRHATIGSMADLTAADLNDVRKWFIDNYGPNNVVLALTGDIDAATARPQVERWFGHIPTGPEVRQPEAGPVTLTAATSREMVDQVATTRLYRAWSGPGLNEADSAALQVAAHILGGLASSRLDNALVRGEQLAVAVTAGALPFEQTSMVQVSMDVKPGVERATAEARLDAVLNDFIAAGPTEDEVKRAATQLISSQVGALEAVGGMGGKGATLAEGELYSKDPAFFRQELARIAALDAAAVRAAMQRWLTRPVYRLAVTPGERTERGETMGGWGDEANAPATKVTPKPKVAAIKPGPKRTAPPVAPVGELTFPALERATLSNGIPVTLARRTAVPKVMVSVDFDAGYSADTPETSGAQSLMLRLLEEGTTTRSAIQIAEEQERLGASITAGAGLDHSAVVLNALTANLGPSLALMADMIRNPAFAPAEVARVKDQRLAAIAQEVSSPVALARRTLAPLVYGTGHAYGGPPSGLGSAEAVGRQTPEALRAEHDRWLRPDLARITVVGNVTMPELTAELERNFAGWTAPAVARPAKAIAPVTPPAGQRIVIVHRPNSPQSVILAGKVLPFTGGALDLAPDLANEVLGNGFLSRLNMDLREDKGWSYGVNSQLSRVIGQRLFQVAAPVQADRTGDSLRLLLADMKALAADKPVEAVEHNRVTDGNVRTLPNLFETNAQVLGALTLSQRLGRPDDYYSTLSTRYRGVTQDALNAAARRYLTPDNLTIVIVGDRAVIEPQLKGIGIPVEVRAGG